MFSKYYQSELTYLRELGREFALANPSTAGMLAERGGDPDVERLLEGFAFLTARIRERIDDDVPEIVHSLTDLLLPHYLRTIPAATILEFTPIPGALRGRHRVARGAEVCSVPVEGTPCRFRTTTDVDLLPLQLIETQLDTAVASTPALRIQLQTNEQGRAVVFQPDGVRFFVHGEYATAAAIMLWLARFCRQVTVRGASGKGKTIRLPLDALRLVGFEPEDALLPWPKFAPEGYRLVQEYFTLPAKFLFFEVRGLEAALEAAEDRFEIALHFERPPPLPTRIGRDVLKLHCAPAINLFRVDADPIRRDPSVHEYLLRASEVNPHHAEVYSVDGVTGLQAGRSERRVYKPFFDFGHSAERPEEAAYYRVRRAPSPIDDGIDTYLSIYTPRDVAPVDVEEVLSIDLTCTNRSAPGDLRVGDVSVPSPGSPTVAKFKNIIPVSKPVRPPFGVGLHWRLISHMVISQRSLTDAAMLRAALELYNFQGASDRQAGRANRLRVEAIRSATAAPVERLFRGIPVRGLGTTLEIEEANFAGEGDVYLFGAVIEALLAASATINSFSELTIRLQPSQAEYTWPAKSGRQPIL